MSLALDLLTDSALLLGFALPHSLLLRPAGRRLMSRFAPRPVCDTTYGLISSLQLLAVYAFWRELPGTIWAVEGDPARALLVGHALSWAAMGLSLFHYGALRQPGLAHCWELVMGRREPAYRVPRTGPFRLTRHPVYVSMFLMLWVTPWMTTGHLLVSIVWTGYLVAGVVHKERRLRRRLGEAWTSYAARVPALPIPIVRRGQSERRAGHVTLEAPRIGRG